MIKFLSLKDLITELQKIDLEYQEYEVCVRCPDDEEAVIELEGKVYYSPSERCVIIESLKEQTP